MIVIEREIDEEYNPEFFAIRERYVYGNQEIPFGTWLRERGVDAVTNVPESAIGRHKYFVTKIIFNTEQDYLAFKLKYM